MKKAMLLALLMTVNCTAFWTVDAHAQDFDSGFYGTIDVELSYLNEGTAWVAGLGVGYQTEQGYRVGAVLFDLLNGTPQVDEPNRRTKMHWGGLYLGKAFETDSIVRPVAGVVLGGGDVSVYNSGTKKKDSFDQSFYGVVQPSIGLEAPMGVGVVPQVDVGWRLIAGSSTPGTSDGDLSGPFINLSLRLGAE